MNRTTTQYPESKRDRILKPVFGAIAAMATLATLGLTVAAPSVLARGDSEAAQAIATRTAGPTEVAILPATIEVTAKRPKVATGASTSPYMPASYRVR